MAKKAIRSESLVIIGHRGKGPTSTLSKARTDGGLGDVPKGLLPENTLISFDKAIQEGADGIELDIFISKDGVPMVIHDNELNRNVAGASRKGTDLGMLEDYTAAELQRFDVGQGQSMPTLEEVIHLISEKNMEREEMGLPPSSTQN